MSESPRRADRQALELYAWLGPLLLAPLSALLWMRELGQPGPALAVAWGLPIAWGYLVPGIGTNLLKVWEWGSRHQLGRFRPQHGFVFGSATALLAWLVHTPAHGWADVLRCALTLACVLGFVNLLYDIVALRAGLLKVYNQPWADGASPEVVALDYAPIYFGLFGFCYGAALALTEWRGGSAQSVALALLACSAVPTLGYALQSYRRHGHHGCWPVARAAASHSGQPDGGKP